MSYARHGFGGSDVYLFMGDAGLNCCFCSLDPKSFLAPSTQAMVDHLAGHRAAGDVVPDSVVPDLWADDPENFPPGDGR